MNLLLPVTHFELTKNIFKSLLLKKTIPRNIHERVKMISEANCSTDYDAIAKKNHISKKR